MFIAALFSFGRYGADEQIHRSLYLLSPLIGSPLSSLKTPTHPCSIKLSDAFPFNTMFLSFEATSNDRKCGPRRGAVSQSYFSAPLPLPTCQHRIANSAFCEGKKHKNTESVDIAKEIRAFCIVAVGQDIVECVIHGVRIVPASCTINGLYHVAEKRT